MAIRKPSSRHVFCRAAKGAPLETGFLGPQKSQQRSTLPHGFPCSTIGSEELNFQVGANVQFIRRCVPWTTLCCASLCVFGCGTGTSTSPPVWRNDVIPENEVALLCGSTEPTPD